MLVRSLVGEDEIDEEENAQKETEKNRLGALLKHCCHRLYSAKSLHYYGGVLASGPSPATNVLGDHTCHFPSLRWQFFTMNCGGQTPW